MHGEANAMHERLVAYVHALAHGSRRGVWGEHSYARSRIGATRGGGRVRALLAPRPPSPPPALLDVTGVSSPAPSPPPCSPPPCSPPPSSPEDEPPSDVDEDEDEDWERRATAAAPAAVHARLVRAAAAALTDLRLERLAGGARTRRDATRHAARRLRRALAAYGAARGPAQWLHATLRAHLPRVLRRLYADVTEELSVQAPRLSERLTGEPAPPPPVEAAPPAVGPESEPWLVWVSSGSAALDARWERRLAALVHTRVLRLPAGEAAPPEPWCAAAVAAVRHMLTDALADAGERSVVVGGAGAGAGVAAWLARGCGAGGAGGVRGAVCVGSGGGAALRALRLPLLALEAGGAGGADVAAHARLLHVRGADGALRVSRALRRRLALPQRALDAALVEECVRWAVEAAESEEPAPSPPRRRAEPRAAPTHEPRRPSDEEDYSHLPAADTEQNTNRSIETGKAESSESGRAGPMTVVSAEGRVVSRGAGATPLTLLPPQRSAGAGASGGATPALAAADILQLPIVFADDAAPPATLTVTSGSARSGGGGSSGPGGGSTVKLTRVILAKRGAARGAAAGATPAQLVRGATPAQPVRSATPARRVLLRRGVRVLPPHT